MKIAFSSLLLSVVVFAQPFKGDVKAALRLLDDAERAAERSSAPCPSVMGDALDEAGEKLLPLKRSAKPNDAEGMKQMLLQLSKTAEVSGCRTSVAQNLSKAASALETARVKMVKSLEPVPPPTPIQPPAPASLANISPLRIDERVPAENEMGVRVSVPELTLNQMMGQVFSMGIRVRSLDGVYGEWLQSAQWSVPSAPYVWKNGFSQLYKHSYLNQFDTAGGQFMVQVTVFDSNNRQLTTREAMFSLRGPQTPPTTVVVIPSGPAPMQRDCGTPKDPGCQMTRDGQWAMDGATYAGFLQALRANSNEILRAQMCESTLNQNYITAAQLGAILDQFQNEIFRMQAAEQAAPHVVNPQHSYGLATKFRGSIYQSRFVELMSSQRANNGKDRDERERDRDSRH